MNIAIGCTQRFDITVTPELVAVLTKLGELHYDAVCKSAVLPGGFIYGWGSSMGFHEVGEEDALVQSATNGQLQTCLKICEFPPDMTPAELATRNRFFKLGFAALRKADKDARFASSIPVDENS